MRAGAEVPFGSAGDEGGEMGNAIEDVVSLALVLLFIPLCIGLYFLPTIVGARRNVPNLGPLVVVNVFLGWTLIGWVVALAMAVRDVPSRARGSR